MADTPAGMKESARTLVRMHVAIILGGMVEAINRQYDARFDWTVFLLPTLRLFPSWLLYTADTTVNLLLRHFSLSWIAVTLAEWVEVG